MQLEIGHPLPTSVSLEQEKWPSEDVFPPFRSWIRPWWQQVFE